MCKDNFEQVTIKNRNSSVTPERLDLNISGINTIKEDIRLYFTPEKKRKLEDKNVSNESMANSAVVDFDDVFDDGLNDVLCDIDF